MFPHLLKAKSFEKTVLLRILIYTDPSSELCRRFIYQVDGWEFMGILTLDPTVSFNH